MSLPQHRKVCRYLRCSTLDQDPQLQADDTGRFIDARGWTLVESYVDRGQSGSKDRRPGLDRMMRDARRRLFSTVLVWRSDRLFRSVRHMVITLDELAALGIDFVSVTEPALDTTTPQGRLLFHVTAAFAEFERGILVERTKAGLAAARRRGARIGRPRVEVDVARAVQLRVEGIPMRRIAQDLGVGLSTLRRALRAAETRGVPKGVPAVALEVPVISGAA